LLRGKMRLAISAFASRHRLPRRAPPQRFNVLTSFNHFGRRVGTIISVLHEPSSQIRFPVDDDYFPSQLSDSYTHYDRQLFIDTLDDWQFFGPDAEKPVWYSGKSWS
jgi:hypothetical protein